MAHSELQEKDFPIITIDDHGDEAIWYQDVKNQWRVRYAGCGYDAAITAVNVVSFYKKAKEAFNTRIIKKNAWEDYERWNETTIKGNRPWAQNRTN